MPIYRYQDYEPKLAKDVWVAPNAQVIGNVSIGSGSGIWFGCIVRGDVHFIRIGENTNVQDLSLLHITEDKYPLDIGNHCTLGHQVTLHGCTLKDYAFVGIGAIVLDNCELGEFSLLAAGSLLPPNKKIPPRTLAMGVPAKPIRQITAQEESMIYTTPEKYRKLREVYHDSKSFQQISP